MLYSEHTWGAWNSISAPDDPFVTDQWRVKQAFALDAETQSRQLLAEALGPPSAKDVSVVDVFNTTQWARTDVVFLSKALSTVGDRVSDEDGHPVPSQRLASGRLAFFATNVPAFGSARYRLSMGAAHATGSAKVQSNTLSNGKVTATIDAKTGAVASLRLTGLDADLVDSRAPVAINDYRYLLGTDPKDAEPNGPVTITVVDPGPLVATLRIGSGAPGCNSLVREVRVIEGQDRLELTNHVDRKSVRQKDAVHFGFGFNVPGGVVRMETPWAVVRPNADQLPGSCRNWFTVQRWVDVSNDAYGVTWAPIEAPLVQIGGITANLLGQVRLEEWMTKAHESQTIYSWAMNNHWHTNYKADQPGLTTFRYDVRPHRSAYAGMEAARFGMETTRPLVAAAAVGEKPAAPPFTLASANVLVETIKVSEDGNATIVRLFGASGKDERVALRFASRQPAVVLSDLSELSRRAVNPDAIDVPAYGVVTLRIGGK
jgi:alpha-mannosidase